MEHQHHGLINGLLGGSLAQDEDWTVTEGFEEREGFV